MLASSIFIRRFLVLQEIFQYWMNGFVEGCVSHIRAVSARFFTDWQGWRYLWILCRTIYIHNHKSWPSRLTHERKAP